MHATTVRTQRLAATQAGQLAHSEEEGAVEKVLEQTLMLLRRTLGSQYPL